MNTDKVATKYRYFIYSNEQYKLRLKIERQLGNEFKPGIVYVSGQQKHFTEMIEDFGTCRYTDATIVAEGDITKMKYTMPNKGEG